MNLILFTLIPLILSISIVPVFADHEVMSPYQQIKNGVAAEDVICKSGLALMLRPSGDPACVMESSVSQLGTMSWSLEKEATMAIVHDDAEDVVDELEVEEPPTGNVISVELEESIGLKGN